MKKNSIFDITDELLALSERSRKSFEFDPELYTRHNVKRGLRDLDGRGVLTGLTKISEICSKQVIDGREVPCEGRLFYRGYDIKDLVSGFIEDGRFGFEETVYLLLFGKLPTQEELSEFCRLLAFYRSLPSSFVRDVIMKAPSPDMMNTLARSVLTMYAYDKRADDISLPNVLRQCLQLIAVFPLLSVYGYRTYRHYHNGRSLFINTPDEKLSTAENILHMLRKDSRYTELEAKLLDLSLVLHAEHGGGNNSTFTTHVVSSSGTDTYSVVAASLGSLKGPRHGGANIKVSQMFDDLIKTVGNPDDEGAIKDYLLGLLRKERFDRSGLIYGMGHAVYSLSDPRADILRGFVKQLSEEKGKQREFGFYSAVERLAPEIIAAERKIYKGVSANVDFYSGLVYSMLNLPASLYTPIFAIARISGWSAHRLEELSLAGKIMRPAYMCVAPRNDYLPLQKRL